MSSRGTVALREARASEIVRLGVVRLPGSAVEGSQDSYVRCFFGTEVVVSAADVLDERVPGAEHLCATELFEAAHRL